MHKYRHAPAPSLSTQPILSHIGSSEDVADDPASAVPGGHPGCARERLRGVPAALVQREEGPLEHC
eukprot:14876999-Alexandrium_andersonii.AAC.1